MNPSPLFIVGCFRSGTTLLRVMLSNHSDIFLCEEMLWLAPILERREEYGDLEDDDNVMRLLRDISRMLERPPA